MKKNKIIFSTLLAIFILFLTSCSLFNDDDIEVKNTFTPYVAHTDDSTGVKAGGVTETSITDLPNTSCFKNICYAIDNKILNTYKTTGVNYNGYTVNDNNDYEASKSRNNYDLYVPTTLDKTGNNTIILFIHGGAWVSGFKTDVNPYVYEFAKKGYISATIKYTLLKRTMDDSTLSIFRDLDEIDACIASIKNVLKNDLGFDDTKLQLVIGGASSGAHLSMLYSYSRGDKSPLPIKFIIDAVGPTDIKSDVWKRFVDPSEEVLTAGIDKDSIATQEADSNLTYLGVAGEDYSWNDFQTMKIANGMCGLPYTLDQINATTDEYMQEIVNPNEAFNSLLAADGGEDLLSATYWINHSTNKYPIVCAYGGKDSIVGIKQYANLQAALDANSITYSYIYFKNSDHTEITKEKDSDKYNQLINQIDNWCKNEIA